MNATTTTIIKFDDNGRPLNKVSFWDIVPNILQVKLQVMNSRLSKHFNLLNNVKIRFDFDKKYYIYFVDVDGIDGMIRRYANEYMKAVLDWENDF